MPGIIKPASFGLSERTLSYRSLGYPSFLPGAWPFLFAGLLIAFGPTVFRFSYFLRNSSKVMRWVEFLEISSNRYTSLIPHLSVKNSRFTK